MRHTQHRVGLGCSEKVQVPVSAQALCVFGGTEYAMFDGSHRFECER